MTSSIKPVIMNGSIHNLKLEPKTIRVESEENESAFVCPFKECQDNYSTKEEQDMCIDEKLQSIRKRLKFNPGKPKIYDFD